ncbi:MAG: hypothetical protein PSN36_06145 [Gammaproteobacteria bacterium]|nr:hypothetical protein [Gammaproteobacteria bacterium]
MIDGIDYYPRQTKTNKKSLVKWLSILFFALIIIAIYYFFNELKVPKTPSIGLIVIKEAEIEKIKVSLTPINVEGGEIQPRRPEILENLDEIIQK